MNPAVKKSCYCAWFHGNRKLLADNDLEGRFRTLRGGLTGEVGFSARDLVLQRGGQVIDVGRRNIYRHAI